MASAFGTIALRVSARRIAVVRQETRSKQDRAASSPNSARNRWTVIGHLDRAKALNGADLTSAIIQRLSPGEAMQARIALERWRADQQQEARRGQMAQAAAELDRLTALFAAEELSASELLAAVEQVRLRTVITAWEALGITLRERAKRHGLEHLFTGLPRTTLTDEDPVVIASDESETQTLSERDAERLRSESP